VIDVRSDDVEDTEAAIRYAAILDISRRQFAGGNFNAPMLVHGVAVPGMATITRLKTNFTGTWRRHHAGKNHRDDPTTRKLKTPFTRFSVPD
jgi:hypothetical protein